MTVPAVGTLTTPFAWAAVLAGFELAFSADTVSLRLDPRARPSLPRRPCLAPASARGSSASACEPTCGLREHPPCSNISIVHGATRSWRRALCSAWDWRDVLCSRMSSACLASCRRTCASADSSWCLASARILARRCCCSCVSVASPCYTDSLHLCTHCHSVTYGSGECREQRQAPP